MNPIFETVGLLWVILTSTLATIGLFYFAWIGYQVKVRGGKMVIRETPENTNEDSESTTRFRLANEKENEMLKGMIR